MMLFKSVPSLSLVTVKIELSSTLLSDKEVSDSETVSNLFSSQNKKLSTVNVKEDKKEGPKYHKSLKQSVKPLANLVGMSAGLVSPDTKHHLSLSTTFLMFTTLFSIQGFQDFFFLPLSNVS